MPGASDSNDGAADRGRVITASIDRDNATDSIVLGVSDVEIAGAIQRQALWGIEQGAGRGTPIPTRVPAGVADLSGAGNGVNVAIGRDFTDAVKVRHVDIPGSIDG